MKRPTVKLSLIASTAGMVLLTAALFCTSISSLSAIDTNSDQIIENWLPSVERSKEMDTALSDLRVDFDSHVLASTAEQERTAEKAIDEGKARFFKAVDDYSVLASEEGEKFELRKIRDTASQLIEASGEMIAASQESRDEDAKQIISKEMAPRFAAIADSIDTIVAINKKGAASSGAEIQQLLMRALNLVCILCGVTLFLGLGTIVFAVAGIAKPISRIDYALSYEITCSTTAWSFLNLDHMTAALEPTLTVA